VLTGTMLLAVPADAAPPSDEQPAEFTKGVKIKNLFKHLTALLRASDANGGNRASGLPAYGASVDYVVGRLTEAGYTPVVQEFDFMYTEENSELERISPNPTTYVSAVIVMNEGQPGRTGRVGMIGDATGLTNPGRVRDVRSWCRSC
jgi:hypothetical protein